jgi:hypothetical protein
MPRRSHENASVLSGSRQESTRSRRLSASVPWIAILIAALVLVLPLGSQYRQQERNDRLFAAIRADDASAVTALLNAGAEAAAHDRVPSASFRDFLFAKLSGHALPQGPSTLSVALALALRTHMRGSYPVIHTLLEHHADVKSEYIGDPSDSSTTATFKGYPLIIMAANMEDMSCARDLAAHGADVDAFDSAGRTALMYAAMDRRIAVVKALLELKAKVDLKDSSGWSALDFARQHYGSGDHAQEEDQDKRDRSEVIRLLTGGRPE